jgi:hypothetical protein
MLIAIGSRVMFRPPRQQIKRVWQHRQNRRQRSLRPRRAARQIHDQRLSKRPTHRTTQRSKRSMPQALGAHTLRQSIDHPFTDQLRSLRRYIPRSQPRPSSSHNQTRTGRVTPQSRCNQVHIIRQNLVRHHNHPSDIQQLTNCGPGKVDLLPSRTTVADRQYNCANIGENVLSHASQSTGFSFNFRNFASIASPP